LVNGGDVINRAGELEQAGCRVYVISGLLGDGGDVFPTERKFSVSSKRIDSRSVSSIVKSDRATSNMSAAQESSKARSGVSSLVALVPEKRAVSLVSNTNNKHPKCQRSSD
jgi:hypothetical protein